MAKGYAAPLPWICRTHVNPGGGRWAAKLAEPEHSDDAETSEQNGAALTVAHGRPGMPRPAKLWRRKNRPGWWATIAGKQVCFGEDYQEALAIFHEEKARQPSQTLRIPILVAVAADRYLGEVQPNVSPRTYTNYQTALQHWVDSYERTRVGSMTEDHLISWLDRPEWSPSTRNAYGKVIKGWMRWCKRKKMVTVNPFSDVRLPPIATRDPAPPGSLAILIEHASPEFADFLTVLQETGCRPGELRTLEASTIHWDESTATVSGKTGPRLIGLSDRAVAILRRYADRKIDGPVMRSPRGKAWGEDNLKSTMQDLRDRLVKQGIKGVEEVVAYHTRHEFWGRATKAGVGDVVISKQLGHANLNMLKKHYAHEDHEIMREAARRASADSDRS